MTAERRCLYVVDVDSRLRVPFVRCLEPTDGELCAEHEAKAERVLAEIYASLEAR